MNELEIFANQFKAWKGNRRHVQYPKLFWDKIRELTKSFSIDSIAQACEVSAKYLGYKIPKEPTNLTFTQVQVASIPSQVVIEFVNHNSCPMTIRFQANHEQLTDMILALSKGAS